MFDNVTDKAWEKFGASDPYFGVLTHEDFHKENMSEQHRSDFFRSGRDHIDRIVECVRAHVKPGFSPARSLDFGCGVGRLVAALAKISPQVVGVDVSPSMLAEAKRNCDAFGLDNVELLLGDDTLACLSGEKFDFIHSFIVFQHIPVCRGERIIRNLLAHLRSGGVGALHVVYDSKVKTATRLTEAVKSRLPMVQGVINMLKGRPVSTPVMQMNSYRLNTLIGMFYECGARQLHLELTDHSGYLGVIVYFTNLPTDAAGTLRTA